MSRRLLLLLPIAIPGLVVAVLLFGHDPVEYAASRPMIHRVDDFVGSETCRSCHLDHHESWERTFHRTMTQRVTPETVRGRFDGRELTYEGQTARVLRRDGRFYFDVPDGQGRREAEVVLAVGSRRYQQYFEREEHDAGFSFKRLPFLWHIGERRWLHMNTVFLGPDNADWNKTRARWNDNCVFCHNTGPRPGETIKVSSDGERQFDSEVAELGIACESCHGPGSAYIKIFEEIFRSKRTYKVEELYAAGLTKIDATACTPCHNADGPTAGKDYHFDFDKKIDEDTHERKELKQRGG